jgi:hypothetical protein
LSYEDNNLPLGLIAVLNMPFSKAFVLVFIYKEVIALGHNGSSFHQPCKEELMPQAATRQQKERALRKAESWLRNQEAKVENKRKSAIAAAWETLRSQTRGVTTDCPDYRKAHRKLDANLRKIDSMCNRDLFSLKLDFRAMVSRAAQR